MQNLKGKLQKCFKKLVFPAEIANCKLQKKKKVRKNELFSLGESGEIAKGKAGGSLLGFGTLYNVMAFTVGPPEDVLPSSEGMCGGRDGAAPRPVGAWQAVISP